MIPNSTPPGGPPSWNDGQKKNSSQKIIQKGDKFLEEELILYIFGMFKFLFLKSSLRYRTNSCMKTVQFY